MKRTLAAMVAWLATLANSGPWACPYCGAPYSSDAEGAAHMASAHPGYPS
jgi:hypothetical protein